ncbi:MAG: hypothetical protein B6U69_03180 [Thermofilum sp. ex4484_15]|nr:MAG: hypothetical protein B6U69_03180 [Thermofilum sp. ex4484_15]
MRGLRLKEIRIRGFKAFNKEVRLNLDYNTVILIGPVGTGKSSVIQALEFALYGTTYDVRVGKLLKLDDLINDFSDKAEVTVKLVDEEGRTYEIIRVKRRGRRTTVRLLINGGPYSGDVQSMIEGLLGLDHDAFSRHILIKHDVLNALIKGPPLRRSEAIDKLLGIETLEECFRSISLRTVEEEISKVEGELNNLKIIYGGNLKDLNNLKVELKKLQEVLRRKKEEVERLEGRLSELESKMHEYLNVRRELDKYETLIEHIKEELRGLKYGIDLEEVKERIKVVVEDVCGTLEEFLLHEEAEKLRKALNTGMKDTLRILRDALYELKWEEDKLRSEIMEINEELINYRNKYENLTNNLRKIRNRLEELKPLVREYEKLSEKYGNLKNLERRIAELNGLRKDIEDKIRAGEERVDLINKVIKELTLSGSTKCPVCRSKVTREKIRELEAERDKIIKSEYSSLRKELERVNSESKNYERIMERMKELSLKLSDYADLVSEESKLKEEEEDYLELIREDEDKLDELRFKLDNLRKLLSKVEGEVEVYEKYLLLKERLSKLREYETKVRQLRERLKRIDFNEDEYKKAIALKESLNAEIASLKAREKDIRGKVEKLTEAVTKIRELTNILNNLRKFKDELIEVKNYLREVQRVVREKRLRDLTEYMNYVFKQIYVHKDLTSLKIDVERAKTEEGYERSVYNILAKRASDGAWIPVYSKLSDGQRAIVALSLVLSLFKMASCNFMTVIFDEPVPNVDSKCKEALLRMITRIEGIEQVILATQDEKFKEIEGPGRFVVYSLSHGGKEGPRIEEVRVVHE